MIGLIIGFIFLLGSALSFGFSFLPAETIAYIPFNSYISEALQFLNTYGVPSFLDQSVQLYFVPAVLLFFALYFVITLKRKTFWFFTPYIIFVYYSFYTYFQLIYKQTQPAFILERLVNEPLMALILLTLIILLELLLGTLFFILLRKIDKFFQSRRKVKVKVKKEKKNKKIKKEKKVKEKVVKEKTQTNDFPKVESIKPLKTIAPSVKEVEMSEAKEGLRESYNPMVALKEQLEKEKQLQSLKSVTPKVPEVEKQPEVIEPKAKPIEIAPQVKIEEIETYDDEEDVEQLSGVGGLVSSGDGKDALLSRKKINYQRPPENLLDTYPDHKNFITEETRAAGEDLVATLNQFKISSELVNIVKGPTVTMFEVSPAPGVRVSSILSLSDNIALRLAARQVRIVAPIPGKQAVGIEVPNKDRAIIGFKDLLSTIDAKTYQVPMVLGRTITGEPVVIELTQTPHLLIAGATGSGKSVCVNSLISSILYRRSPKEVRLILVDPKIVELRVYNGIPHLLTPVITEPKKTIKALEFCLYEMERRYKLLNALAVRNISAYNKKVENKKLAREKLPYIVVVIDEFADLMTTVGKELETLLARLAAMARAVGIHLVLATQRPSANVITGIIKSNIPTRIAFMVASQIDSRIIIDETGAEKLLGKGDMLFAPGWDPNSVRLQGAFLSDEEVERIVEFAKSQGEPDYLDDSFFEEEVDTEESSDDFDDDSSDEALMEKALKIVVERQGASASYLQRRLKIGYNRAARIVEQMEEEGLVGPARGSKPREILRYPD